MSNAGAEPLSQMTTLGDYREIAQHQVSKQIEGLNTLGATGVYRCVEKAFTVACYLVRFRESEPIRPWTGRSIHTLRKGERDVSISAYTVVLLYCELDILINHLTRYFSPKNVEQATTGRREDVYDKYKWPVDPDSHAVTADGWSVLEAAYAFSLSLRDDIRFWLLLQMFPKDAMNSKEAFGEQFRKIPELLDHMDMLQVEPPAPSDPHSAFNFIPSLLDEHVPPDEWPIEAIDGEEKRVLHRMRYELWQVVRQESKRDRDARHWRPPDGFIGTKEITQDYKVPRTTLQGWEERDQASGRLKQVKSDPQTGENYYPKAWFLDRLGSYRPRKSKHGRNQ